MTAITRKPPTWPVVETFGPTIQGEGIDQGVVCHFVRFGGCDFRCTWCDTPYAVIPQEIRANAQKLGPDQIVERLEFLGKAPWVILTGGNPALHDLAPLVEKLHEKGFLIAVETQGSRWRDWFKDVDRLCVSPKPPSAQESKSSIASLQRFFAEAMKAKVDGSRPYEWLFLKVVCFEEEDLDFAEAVRSQLSDTILYLSAGNDAGRTVGEPERFDSRILFAVRNDLLNNTNWLVQQVFKRPALCQSDVMVQHQLHTALWGNGQGF